MPSSNSKPNTSLLLLFLSIFLLSSLSLLTVTTAASAVTLNDWSTSLTRQPPSSSPLKKKQFFGGSFKGKASSSSKSSSKPSTGDSISAISDVYVPSSSWSLCTSSNLLEPSTISSLFLSCSSFLTSPSFLLTSPGSNTTIWTLTPPPSYFGSEYTIVKSSAYIPASPLSVTSLIMDSKKVKLYNSISKGREDLIVIGKDVNEQRKIVVNRTRPPMQKVDCLFKTMMASRRNGDGSYEIVSRGCVQSEEELKGCKGSTIILGYNRLREEGEGTRLEGFTWVEAKGVPGVVARKIGVKGGKDFVKSLRKAFGGE
ncbi:hypothetical protein TrST_g2923 [Triparma strigata]|uniref:Uncharacterized protein n=2 Tax=Triparma strigata TaxID=1606541 RepID=A0A9W7BVS0_9STRA|nr:hypothetical protein TrST_g2923 [Triparma strigata]